MRLYEHEAKALAREYGIPVPDSVLWPNLWTGTFPAVAKAQLLEGGRGKRGGIRVIEDAADLERQAVELLRGSSSLGPASAVLVEEHLQITRELYIAFVVDREARGPLLLASPDGGVEVESATDSAFLTQRIDVEAGEPDFAGVRERLRLDSPTALGDVLSKLWRFFMEEDCSLLEVNPLCLTAAGDLVVADLRVVLDDNSRFRHPRWPERGEGSDFERGCAANGAVGVELEGQVGVISNGAGLGLATLDLLQNQGATSRCFVDLAGNGLRTPDGFVNVIRLVQGLAPRAILISLFFQLSSCEDYAARIKTAFEIDAPTCPVIVRLAGNRAAEAVALLDGLPLTTRSDLLSACAAALAAAGVQPV